MTDSLPLISIVFISYNRAHTLVAAYESFCALTDYPREKLELVLADDASDSHTQSILARMDFDVRAIASRNAGLGANQNRGMAAASGEYILMLQDDWMLIGRRDYLRLALQALQANPDIGMVLFRDRPELEVIGNRNIDGHRINILAPTLQNGHLAHVAHGVYSDNPHLKRREFQELIGPFAEGVPMTKMELDMSRRVAAQSRYSVATIDGFEVFKHIGDKFSFNPGERRARRITALKRLPGGTLAYDTVRAIVHRLRKT